MISQKTFTARLEKARLEKYIQAYADQLLEEDRFEHAQGLDVGENLACATNMSETVVDEGIRATKSWYDEIGDYDYDNPVFGYNTGHFT